MCYATTFHIKMVHCTEREVIMKTKINSSVKRAVSLVIAFALLIGTLFTANVGININADAETSNTTVQKTRIVYWSGNIGSAPTKGGGTEDNPFIIETAEQLNWLCIRASHTDTRGKFYKVDPTIKAFILQPEAVVKNLTEEVFMDLSSANDTKIFFEENASDFKNWITVSYDCMFDGNFDGNGVEIYGLYGNAALAGCQSCGLFNYADGGGTGKGTSSAPEIDNTGITIKNFAVRNSYFKSYRRGGIIVGATYGDSYVTCVKGYVNINNCEVTNNFFVGQNWDEKNNKINDSAQTWGTGSMAIVVGNCDGNDKARVDNCIIYGNATEYRDYTSASEYRPNETYDGFNRTFANNATTNDSEGNSFSGSLTNSLVLGTKVTNVTNVENVYSDVTGGSQTSTLTSSDAKGQIGKRRMSVTWATDGDTAYGKWYVREDNYPTLSYPGTDWKDIEVTPIFSGSQADFENASDETAGTKENPYIIKTPAQLYKMVKSGEASKDKYYKVADGVTKLYLSDIECNENVDYVAKNKDSLQQWSVSASANKTGEEIKIDGNDYCHYSITVDTFWGHFDGNGVTITGMVSKNGHGFFGGMYGSASIKNVNFENCYVYGTQAAVITTKFGMWNDLDTEHSVSISNVSVRDCYLESTSSYVGSTNRAGTAAGLVATRDTPDFCTIIDCLFDKGVGEVKQAGNPTDVTTNVAGIASFDDQCFNLINCVSLGLRPFNTPVGVQSLARYDGTKKIYAQYCYTDTALPTTDTADYWTAYPVVNNITVLSDTDVSDQNSYGYLDFINNWTMTEVEGSRTIPMPQTAKYDTFVSGEQATYTDVIKNYKNNLGLKSGNFPTHKGDYGWQEDLTGSGTEADPYIIDTPLKLAIAIATGGQLAGQPLYYKLACDIDLGGMPWIDASITAENQPADQTQYKYTSFSGTLDGDGHIVKGLRSINGDVELDTFTALIPRLDGGTVKNLHLRNSFVRNANSSAKAGGIVGYLCTDGSIIGCSTETTSTSDDDADNEYAYSLLYAYGDGEYTVSNSYYITANGTAGYRDADGETPDDATTLLSDTDTWYQVPKSEDNSSDGKVRLVNQLKSGEQFDLDGNGTFDSKDITILVSKMLGKDGYTNAYADVNYDGRVNILDLVLARRAGVGNFEDTRDGFWRNVELGKVSIYYDCNDNYDSARKLQLYIESVYPTVSITKYTAGTVVNGTKEGTYTNQDNAVVINKNTSLDYDKYNVTYDYKTNVLKINGGSFTAVEQAVLDLIGQKTHVNKTNPTNITNGTTATTKAYRTVYTGDPNSNDTTTTNFYYAWGDEFDGDTLNRNTWFNKPFKQEGTDLDGKDATEAGDTRFLNLEEPNVANIDDLWAIEDGKLSIKRGVNTDVYTGKEDYSWGYVGVAAGEADTTNDYNSNIDSDDIYIDAGLISTEKTMLFKQGYAEMKASLPFDGHAFPSWWFMGGTGAKNNNLLTSLYNKVYKENSNYKTGEVADPEKFNTTYQYILPTAYLEFDIVEFMQTQSGWSDTQGTLLKYYYTGLPTGNYEIDYMQFTVHKWYSNYVKGDTVYIPNWDNDSNQTVTSTVFGGDKGSEFIHKYKQYTDTSKDNGYYLPYANSKNAAFRPQSLNTSKTIKDECTYGFYWVVYGDNYRLTVFADYNNDGTMAKEEVVFSMDQKVPQESDTINYTDGKEGEVWDQYMYMILDNAYYTSNPNGTTEKAISPSKNEDKETGVTMFTDLLSYNSSKGDKTTFDIDYVRVYQQDGKRDLVTAETEAFNTGSHFGY